MNILLNHIRDMKKRHPLQNWYIRKDNEIHISFEGIDWLIKVSFDYSVKKIDADINFFKKLIYTYENQLQIRHAELDYKDMTRQEICLFFNKSTKHVQKTIRDLTNTYGTKYKRYKKQGKLHIAVISAEGIKILEENYFKKSYLKRLEIYQLELKNTLINQYNL